MLFSVVVPVKNAQKDLPECILSVLRQTCRDFELLLVYTDSSDDSFDCCRRFANVDARIRLLKSEENTAFAAKRMGVEEAQGEYVTVLFPDGRIGETFLFDIKCALKRGAELVAYPKAKVNTEVKKAPFSYAEGRDDYREMLLYEKGINQHFVGFFAPKDFYLTAFSYFHEGIEADEDDLLLFACFARAKSITFCSDNVYTYLGRVFFPRPHGLARICSEEILFQRLNAVADDTDSSFARNNVVRHAFLVTAKELRNLSKDSKETFYEGFLRVLHSAYFYALRRLKKEDFDKKDRRILRWIVRKRKRTAYFFLSKRKERK